MRLELESVTAAYGDTVALRDVSLVVPSGRVAALLGPNGAGKTTLLSAASGLLRPLRPGPLGRLQGEWRQPLQFRLGIEVKDRTSQRTRAATHVEPLLARQR